MGRENYLVVDENDKNVLSSLLQSTVLFEEE